MLPLILRDVADTPSNLVKILSFVCDLFPSTTQAVQQFGTELWWPSQYRNNILVLHRSSCNKLRTGDQHQAEYSEHLTLVMRQAAINSSNKASNFTPFFNDLFSLRAW